MNKNNVFGVLFLFLMFLGVNTVNAQDNPRGYETRNGVRYMYEILFKGHDKTKHTVRIKKEENGKSYLVYATDIIGVNKPEDGHYMIKIYEAKENGYRWDIDRKSFIKMKFFPNGEVDPSVVGNMKNMKDNNHGYTSEQLKSKCSPGQKSNTNLQYIAYLKAACKYLILKYPKVFKTT